MQDLNFAGYEKQRLINLDSYQILDTLPENEYDEIVQIASLICNTPIAIISLIDEKRQWFKSSLGVSSKEIPREYSFCSHTIDAPSKMLIVNDSSKDIRFADNPFSMKFTNGVFYAGVSLINSRGYALGTLCVIDNKPSGLSEAQIKSLVSLSNQVVAILELRKEKKLLLNANLELTQKNQTLENFARIAAHDLSSPLRSIANLIELFWTTNGKLLNDEGVELFKLIGFSANQLRRLIDGIVEYSTSDKLLEEDKENIHVSSYLKDVVKLLDPQKKYTINVTESSETIAINKAILKQILINLISNAIIYNDKAITMIEIGFNKSENNYNFYVKDNGPGIKAEDQEKIFKIYQILTATDRNGLRGSGIGLATAEKLVEAVNGEISVSSEIGNGSVFSFRIPI
jgi:signal transduction histidine kinase